MSLILICCFIILAYLLGSLPTAVWYGKAYFDLDVRDYGSGNAGATNTFRVLGKKAGSTVMLIDMLKGWTATSLAFFIPAFERISYDSLVVFQLIFGVAAVLGHIFPVFERFKGGKGVATLLGMVFSIHPTAALICLGVFLIVFISTRFVSLSSMIAAAVFPFLMLLPRFHPDEPAVIVFGFCICAMVIITHQKNIKRLIHGEENKMNIRIRKGRNS